MNNKNILAALSMDLKRVALGYHKGSIKVAERFSVEALKRKDEIDSNAVKPYIKILLNNLERTLNRKDRQKIAEDSLMISTLLQNYTLYS